MSAALPVVLAALSGLLAAAAAVCASRAGLEATRFLRGRVRDLPASAPGRGPLFARLAGLLLLPLGGQLCAHAPARALAGVDRLCVRAGRPFELTVPELAGLAALGGCAGALAGAVLGAQVELALPMAVLLALGGLAAPFIWLRDEARLRRRRIERALPSALDLLTLSVEAGLDFAAALARVVERGRGTPLADELGLAVRQLKLGKTREEALRALAERVDLASLRTFVQALVQADRMGTPLGRTLRILSSQLRAERSERAEKLANEAPVKLLLPLLGCIFPTLFLMLFGPIAYDSFFSGGG